MNTSFGDFGGMDGGGYGGGGGFVNSPPGRALEGGGDASSPGRKKGEQQSRGSLTPVTIRMLFNADQGSGDGFMIDGHELQTVCLIGLVKSSQEQSTHTNYVIDDGTGSMDARIWVDPSDDTKSFTGDAIRDGDYVRICGHLREYQNQRNILALKMYKIQNYNEVTHHILEVIFVHLNRTKGPLPTPQAAVAQTNTGGFGQQYQGMTAPRGGQVPSAYMRPDQAMGMGPAGLSGIQQQVLDTVSSLSAGTKNQRGVHVNDIVRALMNNATETQIKTSIEFLVTEGQMFTTVDDYHVRRCS